MREEQEQHLTQLIRAAQQGCNKSYHEFLVGITPLLAGFIHKRIGQGNDHDDILQEVLIGVHKATNTFNTDRSLYRWLFAIADYKVKDYLRAYYRKNRYQTVDIDNIAELLTSDETFCPVSNELTVGNQLDHLLAILPERQREIIRLMKIQGFSSKEVAEQLSMSETNVKVTAHRGYQILRQQAQTAD